MEAPMTSFVYTIKNVSPRGWTEQQVQYLASFIIDTPYGPMHSTRSDPWVKKQE